MSETEANGGNVDNGEKQKPCELESRLEKKCSQTISFWNQRRQKGILGHTLVLQICQVRRIRQHRRDGSHRFCLRTEGEEEMIAIASFRERSERSSPATPGAKRLPPQCHRQPVRRGSGEQSKNRWDSLRWRSHTRRPMSERSVTPLRVPCLHRYSRGRKRFLPNSDEHVQTCR